ncbi:valine--tRNA ligase [Patescibacteria group bacterium]|nr:valine--tRNA ligase [Patescibacteria group bacterium]
MEKTYNPNDAEKRIYRMWEDGGYFTPRMTRGKPPFSILLPLPNANDPMHMGHAMFTVQDILIRYHRMLGNPTLWLPGGDHAGIETQYVFEKKLAKEGKSRFQFDRETLYRMIEAFVEQNKNINRDQMKRLGFSMDWTRYRYSLDPDIVAVVCDTFRKLHADGLVYRDARLVNYCTKDGTGFSDLEVKYVERTDPLYYIKYGPFTIATVRPETKFRDTALAVNPKDKRYKNIIGKAYDIPGLLGPIHMTVIPDPEVDMSFGTGIMKVTPAHDPHDFDLGKKFNLPVTPIITHLGRMDFSWFLAKRDGDPKFRARAEKYHNKKVAEARLLMIEDLKEDGLLVKTDEEYSHRIGTCYRCGSILEPLPIPQWYVRTKTLAMPAIQAVRAGKTKIVPKKRFEKLYFDWLKNITDWNISRQIVWGPRIPVWYCLDCNSQISLTFVDADGNKITGRAGELLKTHTFSGIEKGLQSLSAPLGASYSLDSHCGACHGDHILQETDTFDTWFLSSQWPITTLGYPDGRDFRYFYPTSVLDTMWDILFFWVARMMMMGLYRTGKVPFQVIHLHSRVVDAHGQKMSKSKGNVMNPIDMVEKYGADALRFALVFGAAPGSDIAISEDKIRGMRNFANKLWNIGRFITFAIQSIEKPRDGQSAGVPIPFYDETMHKGLKNPGDTRMISELNMLVAGVTHHLERYRFSDAAQSLYDFTWHRLADTYLEENKSRYQNGDREALAVLRHVYLTILKLLHPFMPFVTEEVWSMIPRKHTEPLIVSRWPVPEQK